MLSGGLEEAGPEADPGRAATPPCYGGGGGGGGKSDGTGTPGGNGYQGIFIISYPYP
jgi:hypothetical protein